MAVREDGQGVRFLLVVPPFASADRPSLGAHIVARVAADAGWRAHVDYANLRFAARVGVRAYQRLCVTPSSELIGERVFTPACYDAPVAPPSPATCRRFAAAMDDPAASLADLQAQAIAWADETAARVAATDAEIVGFTSTFEQTLASIALALRIRRLSPGKRLIVGGANVDGVLADGIHALAPVFDHVFAGESEDSVAQFLAMLDRGEQPPAIIRGQPRFALDALPPPDYADYEAQLARIAAADVLPGGIEPGERWLPYESSRGCWWGAKHHCTFCGLNAEGMAYRQKSPAKVLRELDDLAVCHPGTRMLMVDNIMPHGFFHTLLPALAARESRLDLFYEQRANIDHARMTLLAEAGLRRIQPGIEALDGSLLDLMDKGTSLRVNLDCLRWARAVGIDVAWNLLVDFPGDSPDAYPRTAALVPFLAHLQPPTGVSPLSIDRFSPYFDRPGDYGIAAIRPIPAYAAVHPGNGDGAAIAYHFVGDYRSGWRERPDLAEALSARVDGWRAAWKDRAMLPVLTVVELSPGRLLLIDTRPVGVESGTLIDADQARAVLAGKGDPAVLDWAEERSLLWRDGDRLLPLAIADPDLLRVVGAIA